MISSLPIEIEGIDKTGKDTLHYYLSAISGHQYNINTRGILSQLVYNDKFFRKKLYCLTALPIIVYLTVDDADFNIRCHLTNEPYINKHTDEQLFEAYLKELESMGAYVFRYNTTDITPYRIAEDVHNKLINFNPAKQCLTQPKIISNLKISKEPSCELE